jgi:hypothetical protein
MSRAPRWAVGMRKLGPGIYVDEAANAVHFSGAELCAHQGVPATRENVEIAEQAARDVTAKYWPGARVKVVDADPS